MLSPRYSLGDLRKLGFSGSFRGPLSDQEQQIKTLRSMIWLYFWLLICEGALRKWVVPQLSAPLLVIRDPLVVLIYLQAVRCKRFPINGPMVAYFSLLVGFILLSLIQIIAGIGGGPLVAIYGLRTNFLHLPLIFVIPRAFAYADVLKMGKTILMLAIPMALLMVAQYSSPADSQINAATRGDAQQLAFAQGKIRPPGTFSFVTGAAHFYILAATFLVYGLAAKTTYPRWLLVAALLSVAIVQPVSGSRILVLGCGLALAAAITFAILNPGRAPRILALTMLLAAAFVVLAQTSFFREASDVFVERWNTANASDRSMSAAGVQQGLAWRFFGGFLEPFRFLDDSDWIGKGLGMGTNAGSAITTGTVAFQLAEGEWARIVLEAGPLLGFAYLAFRVWIAGIMAMRAGWLAKQQQLLPWLLAWDACRCMVTEQLSQPTNLGFMVLVSGLCLASASQSRGSAIQWLKTGRVRSISTLPAEAS
jgi:hypothetical protein